MSCQRGGEWCLAVWYASVIFGWPPAWPLDHLCHLDWMGYTPWTFCNCSISYHSFSLMHPELHPPIGTKSFFHERHQNHAGTNTPFHLIIIWTQKPSFHHLTKPMQSCGLLLNTTSQSHPENTKFKPAPKMEDFDYKQAKSGGILHNSLPLSIDAIFG